MAKVALVTGSGKRRIGWHVVQALAERGYGLVIHYNTARDDADATKAELQTRGIDAIALGANLADDQASAGLIRETLEHFGRLDALVNCAAIWQRKPLEAINAEDVRRHFDVNALGTFLCSRDAGLAMARQAEGGSIVMFGDWAIARPYLDYAAYFPSKGAVEVITRSLAVELAARNPRVRVNCILPGPVMLPANLSATERQQAVASTLVKREGSPENIVQAVLHFIDNDYITGACLPVDGGRTIYPAESLAKELDA
jgi:pteridine reductase